MVGVEAQQEGAHLEEVDFADLLPEAGGKELHRVIPEKRQGVGSQSDPQQDQGGEFSGIKVIEGDEEGDVGGADTHVSQDGFADSAHGSVFGQLAGVGKYFPLQG